MNDGTGRAERVGWDVGKERSAIGWYGEEEGGWCRGGGDAFTRITGTSGNGTGGFDKRTRRVKSRKSQLAFRLDIPRAKLIIERRERRRASRASVGAR